MNKIKKMQDSCFVKKSMSKKLESEKTRVLAQKSTPL